MPAIGLLPKSLAQTYASRGEIVTLRLDTQGVLSETRCFWRADQTVANTALALFLKCLDQAIDELDNLHFN